MNTNFHATKDQPRRVSAGRHHHNVGGEQYRREMRAALHDLQQMLGQCHNGPSGVRGIVTVGPAPSIGGSNQKKYVPEDPRFLHHFYFLCVTLNADE